jgi:hypothetical protein
MGRFLIAALFFFAVLPRPLVAQPAQSQSTKASAATVLEELKEKLEADSPEKQVRPTRWGEPTDVEVGIYVIDVDEINSASQNFSASIYYKVRWRNPLLKHEGPGPQIRRATSVWTPRFVIANQQQAWSAFPDFVEVMPDGEVTIRQKTWGWFSQPLHLRDFPLDRQTISFHLVSTTLRENHARILNFKEPDDVEMSGISQQFSLPDFDVAGWSAGTRPYDSGKGKERAAGFILQIDLIREPWFYIWKVILPLCLIVIMSWVPRWLDPKDSGTSIGISATAFLTLVAYLFAINILLPRVSYLTRIDTFILLSTFLVFIALMHTVLSSYWMTTGREAAVIYANRIARWIYPLALLSILAVAFTGAGGG